MRYFVSVLFLLLISSFPLSAQPLRGFNTNAYLYGFSNQKFTQEYLDTLNQLRPEVLRFPGGTIANKYHFSRPGYGQNSHFDKRTPQNNIVEFVRLVKALEHPPKVLFVINMFEHFHQPKKSDWDLVVENLAAILYLKKQGVDIAGIELGNEFYIYPVIRGWDIKLPGDMAKKLLTVPGDDWWPDNYKKYNRLAQLYHKAIKKIDPNLKTGIPMGSRMNANHKKWNAFAMQMDFSDAYIQHWYGQMGKSNDEATALRHWEQFAKKVEGNIAELKSTGKEIWITEWNGIDFGFDNDKNLQFKQSSFHSAANARYQQIFDKLDIQISIYHRVNTMSEGNAYNLFNVDNAVISVNPTYWDFVKPPFKISR